MRGDGRTYQRGATYWISFYVDGREQRESAKTADPKQAEKYLRNRLKEVHAHELDPSKPFISQQDKRRTVADLMDALKTDFVISGKDSPQNLSNIARTRADFGIKRAVALSAEEIDGYIEDRLEKGSAPASINRVTQLLKQAYKFAGLPAPRIRRLSEKGNERQGFFSESEIRRVIKNLPDDLGDFSLFGWLTGMRKGEISSLAWRDVDGDVIRLRAENSKNGEARMVPLEDELSELIERRRAARQVKVDGTVMLSALIFHRQGEPIREFRKTWAKACCKAGVGEMVCPNCGLAVDEKRHCSKCSTDRRADELDYRGRIFHDLRRSAVRNMIAAGVAQTIAMKLSGHKTDSMFRRYAIVAESDLRTALKRTQDYLKTAQENVVAMQAKTEGGQDTHNRVQAVAQGAGK